MILAENLNFQAVTVNTDYAGMSGVMGLGDQVRSELFLSDGVYSLWARNAADPVSDGEDPGKNMYGVHPFYMGKAP